MKTEYATWQDELKRGPWSFRRWLLSVVTLGLVR